VARDELIEQVRALAARLDSRSVSRSTFNRETGVSEWQVLEEFDSWNELVEVAGLVPEPWAAGPHARARRSFPKLTFPRSREGLAHAGSSQSLTKR
jgi:hypothetical protein